MCWTYFLAIHGHITKQRLQCGGNVVSLSVGLLKLGIQLVESSVRRCLFRLPIKLYLAELSSESFYASEQCCRSA